VNLPVIKISRTAIIFHTGGSILKSETRLAEWKVLTGVNPVSPTGSTIVAMKENIIKIDMNPIDSSARRALTTVGSWLVAQ
jgi:hypothetical protein